MTARASGPTDLFWPALGMRIKFFVPQNTVLGPLHCKNLALTLSNITLCAPFVTPLCAPFVGQKNCLKLEERSSSEITHIIPTYS